MKRVAMLLSSRRGGGAEHDAVDGVEMRRHLRPRPGAVALADGGDDALMLLGVAPAVVLGQHPLLEAAPGGVLAGPRGDVVEPGEDEVLCGPPPGAGQLA